MERGRRLRKGDHPASLLENILVHISLMRPGYRLPLSFLPVPHPAQTPGDGRKETGRDPPGTATVLHECLSRVPDAAVAYLRSAGAADERTYKSRPRPLLPGHAPQCTAAAEPYQ